MVFFVFGAYLAHIETLDQNCLLAHRTIAVWFYSMNDVFITCFVQTLITSVFMELAHIRTTIEFLCMGFVGYIVEIFANY